MKENYQKNIKKKNKRVNENQYQLYLGFRLKYEKKY